MPGAGIGLGQGQLAGEMLLVTVLMLIAVGRPLYRKDVRVLALAERGAGIDALQREIAREQGLHEGETARAVG